jgi:hypothetical protein
MQGHFGLLAEAYIYVCGLLVAATSPSPFGEVLSFRFVRVRLGFGEQERERLFA